MAEWWVIDKESGLVVNIISSHKPGPPDLSMFRNAERLEATQHPTERQREGYRWWKERP